MHRHRLVLAFAFMVPLAAVVGSCTGGLVAPFDASSDASVCIASSIRFRFVSTSLGTYCVGGPGGCTNDWLSIRKDAGEELLIDRPCLTDCASCAPIGCPASCAAPTRMRSGGEERTWDGTFWAMRTCGLETTCADQTCAAAGHYIARMCAHRDLSADAPPSICSPAETPTCAEVAFDWPPKDPASEVVGVIQGDGGAKCCPATWPMYGCSYPDGGAGLSCHNPALGCPSSTTCGEGCDFVVAGRCGD